MTDRIEWKIGMGIRWSNFNAEEFEGVIIEIDSNVLVVKCADGVTRCVES